MRVLLFYDEEGWAWWHRSHQIQKNIDKSVTIDILKIGTDFDEANYDFIFVFDAYLLKMLPTVPPSKIIVGCSNARILSASVDALRNQQCVALCGNNAPMLEPYKNFPNVFCCQNGVDPNLFYPDDRPTKPLIACWVGNTRSVAQKGLDLIQEACRSTGIPLITLDACAVDGDKDHIWTQQHVRDYIYHSASFYICASGYEGTPNPALEALACGLPVISTPVGNMPEIIRDGYNGFLVERSVESIVSAIHKLRESNLTALSKNARNSIEQGWTWQEQATKYKAMFDSIAKKHATYIDELCHSYSSEPAVEVVLCSDGNESHLQVCLDSFLAQDVPSTTFELLIINNSANNIKPTLECYRDKLQIAYCYSPGAEFSVLRDRALKEISAPLVAFISTDYRVTTTYVKSILAFHRAHTNQSDVQFSQTEPLPQLTNSFRYKSLFEHPLSPLNTGDSRESPLFFVLNTGAYSVKKFLIEKSSGLKNTLLPDTELAYDINSKIPLNILRDPTSIVRFHTVPDIISVLLFVYFEGRVRARIASATSTNSLSTVEQASFDLSSPITEDERNTYQECLKALHMFSSATEEDASHLSLTVSRSQLSPQDSFILCFHLCLRYLLKSGWHDERANKPYNSYPQELLDLLAKA